MTVLLQTSLVLLAIAGSSLGANILGIVPTPARSHNILFQHLIVSLAKAGHNVTYLSAYKQSKPVANLTEIILPFTVEEMFGTFKVDLFKTKDSSAFLRSIFLLPKLGQLICEAQLKSDEMQTLLASDSKFDVVIAEIFMTESIIAGLAQRFKAPVIAFATIQPVLWVNTLVGNIAPTSYIPDPLLGFPQQMTYLQRLGNLVTNTLQSINHHLVSLPNQDKILRKYFGDDLPPIQDILANTSLVFTNDHFSLSYPRPLVPNIIPIGGAHIPPPKKLPEDLASHLDKSKEGAILFSLGSNLKSANMPSEKIQMFLNVFSKLKQNVLWKFEADLTDLPPNVMISKWLPQSDILAHPNIKLFITHGGLLSTTESILRGVPIVGIPIFADQPQNMKQAENGGLGIALEYETLTEDILSTAINKVLYDPKYREVAQLRSQLLKDQPQSPIDSAIYWTEYVIRHKGAPHLRSAIQDLTWYEANQIDVVASLLVILVILLHTTKLLVKLALSKCCRKKKVTSAKKKN